jgi:hypothetical protein
MQCKKVKTKQQNKNINVMEFKPTNTLGAKQKRKEGLESYDKTLAT